LNLSENNIQDLEGLERLKETPIESLNLTRNPVIFTLNYRQRYGNQTYWTETTMAI